MADTPNTLSPSFQEIWAKEQEIQFYKQNVSMQIADTSFDSELNAADTLNRTYRSSNAVAPYVRGSDITIDSKTDTLEQLNINLQYANGFYVDNFDQIQDKYNIAANYGKDNGVYLSNQVDADVLGEALNAYSTVDDGSIGGTSGNGITMTTDNILSIFGAATQAMQILSVPVSKEKYAVVSPQMQNILVQYGAGRDTVMGDKLNGDGYLFDFYQYKIYISNQLTGSAVLSMATQPTDGDTVTVYGQVFTFKTTIGTTAGNVLIGGSADVARANLAGAINNPTVTSANQVALTSGSNAARQFDANAVAVNDNAADTLTVTFKGVGTLVVSKSLTDATDTWTATKQKQYCLFGLKGNPTLVMQKMPSVLVTQPPQKAGKNILNTVLYGVKTFLDNSKQMVAVVINSSTFTATPAF